MIVNSNTTYNIKMDEDEIEIIKEALFFWWRSSAGVREAPLGGYGMEALHDVMEIFAGGEDKAHHHKEVIEAKYFDLFFSKTDDSKREN